MFLLSCSSQSVLIVLLSRSRTWKASLLIIFTVTAAAALLKMLLLLVLVADRLWYLILYNYYA